MRARGVDPAGREAHRDRRRAMRAKGRERVVDMPVELVGEDGDAEASPSPLRGRSGAAGARVGSPTSRFCFSPHPALLFSATLPLEGRVN